MSEHDAASSLRVDAGDDLCGLGAPESVHHRLMAETPRLAWRRGVSDHDQWRAELAPALRRALGREPVAVAPEPIWGAVERIPGGTRQRVSFLVEAGARANAWLLRPAGVSQPPAVVCLQGHSTGAHISVGIPRCEGDDQRIASGRDFARQAMLRGYAALALEQRAFGERIDRRPLENRYHSEDPMSNDHRCGHATSVALLLGRTLVGERVADVSRAIDLLETVADIDLDRLACMGQSGGGTATWYASALEPRISATLASCSLCPYADHLLAYDHCPDNFLPGAFVDFDLPDLAGLVAPKPLVQVCGQTDAIFPVDGSRRCRDTISEIYQALGVANRYAYVEHAGGHDFTPDTGWAAFAEVTGWQQLPV